MTYNVIPTQKFLDDIEYYIKKKKFKNIDNDVNKVVEQLEKGNLIGDPISDINVVKNNINKTYKVRIANSDTKQGKSNGYRMIYYAITDELEIYLLTIYYKKDDKRIPSNAEIAEIIREYLPLF